LLHLPIVTPTLIMSVTFSCMIIQPPSLLLFPYTTLFRSSYMTFEPVTSGSFGGAFVKTSGFGRRKSPGGIGSTNHRGVDFGAPVGTPIPAQMSGKVVASGSHGARGNYVIVESGCDMFQVYQHNNRTQ